MIDEERKERKEKKLLAARAAFYAAASAEASGGARVLIVWSGCSQDGKCVGLGLSWPRELAATHGLRQKGGLRQR
jgi:hypothetical protein